MTLESKPSLLWATKPQQIAANAVMAAAPMAVVIAVGAVGAAPVVVTAPNVAQKVSKVVVPAQSALHAVNAQSVANAL